MSRITVILPVKNAANTIQYAVESILNQSYTGFNLIIINDGSTDSTGNIISSFKDQRIKILKTDGIGISKALNLGMDAANSKYIARMDADDYSYPLRLEKQMNFLDKNLNTGLVSCLVNLIGNKERNDGFKYYVDHINKLISYRQISLNRFTESPFAHPSVMFRKELILKYGHYNSGNIPEDYELWLRWLHKGVRMEKINEFLFDWYDHENRLSRTHPDYSIEAFDNIRALYLVKWLSINNPFHPNIVIWGAGKRGKKLAKLIQKYGCNIKSWIDVNEKLAGKYVLGKPVFYYTNISGPGHFFILSLTSNRNAGNKIKEYLISKNYKEANDFILGI